MRVTIFLIITLSHFIAFGQTTFYIKAIAGNYAMGDMKQFQKEIEDDYLSDGLKVKRILEFPTSIQIELGLDFNSDKTSFGGYLGYATTKGKIHYADYSGETSAEQNLSKIVLGFKATHPINNFFKLYGKVGINMSNLDLIFNTTIKGAGSEEEEFDFYSYGLSLEPGIVWYYPIKDLIFSVSCGYELNVQGKTIFKENEEAHLMDENENNVLINWSGFRLGFGIAYVF